MWLCVCVDVGVDGGWSVWLARVWSRFCRREGRGVSVLLERGVFVLVMRDVVLGGDQYCRCGDWYITENKLFLMRKHVTVYFSRLNFCVVDYISFI